MPGMSDSATISLRQKSEQLGASLRLEGLGVFDGDAGPEVRAGGGKLNALEGEVRAKADLLVLGEAEQLLREAVQM
eukprot:12381766-Alexandrium_andersonii.AAC.1